MNRIITKSLTYLYCVGTLCVAIPAAAISPTNNAPVASATLDRSEVQVADPFRYTVTLTAPAGSKVVFPKTTETLGEFIVLSTKDAFDVPEESGRRWTRIMELETYDSGELTIPAMQIVVNQSSTMTQPVNIKVQSQLDAASDPSQFRELKEIEEISTERSRSAWLLGLAAFLVAAAIGWCLMRKRKSASLSPEQWVSNQLDELRNSHGYQSKNPSLVLPNAADILREYIRRRFDIEAPRQTTDEFLSSLNLHPQLSQGHRQELKGFLQHVDKIKFSNLVPSKDEVDETVSRVRQFVAQTTEEAKQPSAGHNSKSQKLASPDRVEMS